MSRGKLHPALQMTEACNKKCPQCLRTPYSESYKVKYDTFLSYKEDLRTLSTQYTIAHQFVTGGEPTIWRDQGKDVVDILALLEEEPCVGLVTMPSNGKIFEDREKALSLLRRLSDRIDGHVVIGISVAQYQENLDDDGCRALDQVLDICADPGIKVLPIALVTLAVEDDTSERLRRHYPGLHQRVVPLAPLGGGEDFKETCPGLRLSGSDKSSLGAFLPHFRQDVTGMLKITAGEFESLPNAEMMNRLSLRCHCGMSPFIRDGWHYCLPLMNARGFYLGAIGEMEADTIQNFLEKRPLLSSIRKKGVIATALEHRDELSRPMVDKLDALLEGHIWVSAAYRGCMICKELFELGIFDELDQTLGAPVSHKGQLVYKSGA